jgi:hypothetical protein
LEAASGKELASMGDHQEFASEKSIIHYLKSSNFINNRVTPNQLLTRVEQRAT